MLSVEIADPHKERHRSGNIATVEIIHDLDVFGARPLDRDTEPGRTKHLFPGVEVIGRMRPKEEDGYGYGDSEVVQLLHAETGKVILEVGTSHADDYYPGFVAEFHPHNL